MLETLKSILEETDMSITEIRKDAFDFQREILIGGENSRTGKIEAERIIKYREEKLKQKEAMIAKYKTKKATLEASIVKIESQIRKKIEMGDDLKFIDFHQLQIENKKYIKEIDDKNDKLQKLKLETGNIVTKWNNKKKKLNAQLEQKDKQEKDIKQKKEQLELKYREIARFKGINSDLDADNDKLIEQKKKIDDNPSSDLMNIVNFIGDKNEERDSKYEIKNHKRKIEIAELRYIKALSYLKANGYNIDDLKSIPEVEGDDQMV